MKIKQTDPQKIREGQEKLAELKEIRGSVFGMHNRVANDPRLLQAFIDQFKCCNTDMKHIPYKYRELIVMAIGAARGVQTTMMVHAENAIKAGATVDEIGEVLRILFFTCGVTTLIPASEIFEEMPEREEDDGMEETAEK